VDSELLRELRLLRKGPGLNLRRLGQSLSIMAALAARTSKPHLSAVEGLALLQQELEELGDSDEAQATRNAFAIGREHNPGNLSTRRSDYASNRGRHSDTIEVWENHGIEELAGRLSDITAKSQIRISSESASPTTDIPKINSMAAPEPIQTYLRLFPEYAVEHDLRAEYVRTSRESFMAAARLLHGNLKPGEDIIGTDAISFDRDHIVYWSREGLEYLRINHEAAMRGVEITRVFVVSKREREQHAEVLDKLGALQARAGVTPRLAIYEDLPLSCRYEFALFGDHFVDEVVYDMTGNMIIDNQIHWSEHKIATFRERANFIRTYLDLDWVFPPSVDESFDEVVALAGEFSKYIRRLRG